MKNKVVFITGASAGIGKACAVQFAALGCHLILTARRVDRIKTLAADLENEYHIKALALKLDVSDKQQVQKVVSNLDGKWANVDILVNNAGVGVTTELM